MFKVMNIQPCTDRAIEGLTGGTVSYHKENPFLRCGEAWAGLCLLLVFTQQLIKHLSRWSVGTRLRFLSPALKLLQTLSALDER